MTKKKFKEAIQKAFKSGLEKGKKVAKKGLVSGFENALANVSEFQDEGFDINTEMIDTTGGVDSDALDDLFKF